ncbi:MAG: 30S ribosomal protein S6 [Mariprofundaceae bacterium]|nr:30S ribosomal protein S6 [Mariprofundaceae bacterium]
MYYETVFIVSPDVSQENNEVLTNELVDRIEKAGARIVKREYWGSRPLAYSIQKRKRGHYSLLVTDGASNISKIVDDILRLDERVLRFLTTSITELSDEPSPLLRRRIAASSEEAKAADTEASAESKTTETTSNPEAATAESKDVEAEAVESKTAETPVVETKPAGTESGEAAKA